MRLAYKPLSTKAPSRKDKKKSWFGLGWSNLGLEKFQVPIVMLADDEVADPWAQDALAIGNDFKAVGGDLWGAIAHFHGKLNPEARETVLLELAAHCEKKEQKESHKTL